MKKICSWMLALCVLAGGIALLAFPAQAATEILSYSLNSDGHSYTVSGCNSTYSGDLVIPATYEGLPVTAIGDGAFSGCSGLTSVTIPDSVTRIGSAAFLNCRTLESIELPSGLTELGDSAFDFRVDETNPYNTYRNALYLGNTENPYMVLVKGTENTITSCTIHPQTKFIQTYAFRGFTKLTSIVIPNTVLDIGDSAFSGCTGLTDVTIGTSVTNIGYSAFQSCSSLRGIIIPDSVVSIEGHAFYGCENVESITVGTGLKTTGTNAFLACGNDQVYFSDLAAWCQLDAGENGHPGKGANELYLNGELLTQLNIPEGVTKIVAYSFCYYDKLTSITIPVTVTEIGDHAFRSCTNITTIYYDGTSEQWETVMKGVNWDWGCTYGLICLGDPQLDEILTFTLNADGQSYTVTTCDKSFSGSLEIPATYKDLPITAIGIDAFADCADLTEVTLHENIISIGNRAFFGCAKLENIYYGGTYTQMNSIQVGTDNEPLLNAVWHYQIPLIFTLNADGKSYSVTGCDESFTGKLEIPTTYQGLPVTAIRANAMIGHPGITEVIIPDSVTTIETLAFAGCSQLSSVVFGNGLTSIAYKAFYNCPALKDGYVYDLSAWCNLRASQFDNCLMDSITTMHVIDENAEEVTAVTLDSTVTELVYGALEGFKNIRSITIGKNVEQIAHNGFETCEKLERITVDLENASYSSDSWGILFNKNGTKLICAPRMITGNYAVPDTVLAIGESAFFNCDGLTGIAMKLGVTSIGANAFNSCDGLITVTIPDTITDIGSFAFGVTNNIETLIVADGSQKVTAELIVGDYKMKNVIIPNGVTQIGNLAFHGCTGLTKIVIPNTVKTIGEEAFLMCTALKEVELGTGVIKIGARAFQKCYALESVVIPDSVTDMGERVFAECSGLKQAAVGSGVERISDNTFYACDHLTTVVISDGVKTIGYAAFSACSSLKDITIPESVVEIEMVAFSVCDALEDIYYGGTSAQKERIAINSYYNEALQSATWHCKEQEYTHGDLTGDGKINSLDGLILMRYLNGWDVSIASPDAMDVNADGKVNSLDGLILMRYLNGWDVTLG